MASRGERHERIGVPQFGAWDLKAGETNYSMVFSKARAKRKQARDEGPIFRASPSNEYMPPYGHHTFSPPPAFYAPPRHPDAYVFQAPRSPQASQYHQKEDSKTGMRLFMKHFTRCMRP